jgi:serine/threonine-protein phosphatase 2A regulatory subunit B
MTVEWAKAKGVYHSTHTFLSRSIMTGSYNNFFHIFNCETKEDLCFEASREGAKPKQALELKKVATSGKRKKDEITLECLDFNKKILHTAWHPLDNITAVAATNNLYLFQGRSKQH